MPVEALSIDTPCSLLSAGLRAWQIRSLKMMSHSGQDAHAHPMFTPSSLPGVDYLH